MKKILVSAFIGIIAVSFVYPFPAQAFVYTVNSTEDLPDGDLTDNACATTTSGASVCTLRAAVMQANAHAGSDSISVPAGTYTLTRVGIDFTALQGDLDVTDDVTISSTGGTVILDANGGVTSDRLFEVVAGSLALSGFTIQNGNTPSYGGAIHVMSGRLDLFNVVVQNNQAALGGGGIYINTGLQHFITGSLIQNNRTPANGGGIGMDSFSSPVLEITNSTIQNNQATGATAEGGGIYIRGGSGMIETTTIQNNQAQIQGGGLSYRSQFPGENLSIYLSQITNNTSNDSGGGLYLSGITTIENTQVISNTAPTAGGVLSDFGTHIFNLTRVGHNRATLNSCGGLMSNEGSTEMNHSWVEYNSAVTQGGGLCASGIATSRLAITDTQVLYNTATQGGGVEVDVSFFSTRSAIYNNSASYGGGVYVGGLGLAMIENSTLSGNHVGRDGGGIYAVAYSRVYLNSVTLANNQARRSYPLSGSGGGVFISPTAAFTSTASILANNSASPIVTLLNDCSGALRSGGFNFIGSNLSCTITGVATGNQVGGAFPANIDPQLAPLDAISGLTPAHLPLLGSPVIDAGPLLGCVSANFSLLSVDQIGHNRSTNGRCDIGAVEYFALRRALRRAFLPAIGR